LLSRLLSIKRDRRRAAEAGFLELLTADAIVIGRGLIVTGLGLA
jgi:hypothetical protein